MDKLKKEILGEITLEMAEMLGLFPQSIPNDKERHHHINSNADLKARYFNKNYIGIALIGKSGRPIGLFPIECRELLNHTIDRVREDESEKVLRIKGTQEEKDKLKKEILEEFKKKHSYRESINREVHLDFLNHIIDRVRAEREEEVEEIPVMKGTNEALDNITIEKEEECTCRIEYEDRMPITVMCAKHKQEEEERLRKEYSPNEESQIGVSKVETKMEEIVLDNRDENDHEGIQELQIELNELVELVEENERKLLKANYISLKDHKRVVKESAMEQEKIEKKVNKATKLLRDISPYFKLQTDFSVDNLVYKSPSQLLREEADEMEKRDRIINEIRNFLNK